MNLCQRVKRVIRTFQRSSLVLMYHRIASPSTDPWELAVSPENFEQQLQILKETGMVVPVSYLTEQLYSKRMQKPGIVITFDDGYIDNYLTAKPILEQYQLPATFFICTKHIDTQKEFWWDELAYILLHIQNLPRKVAIDVHGISLSFDLNKESVLTDTIEQKHKRWNYTKAPPTRRSQLYMKLWKLLSPLNYQEQQCILEELRQWAGIAEQPQTSYYSMSKDQLLELADKDLFSIGAHTVSHPALAYHSEEVQRQEITQSKVFLAALTGMDIDSFAYPSGNFNETTVNVLKQQGFRAAFTTHHQLITGKDDPYQIGRFQVSNWTGIEFKQVLLNWF